MKSDPQLDYSFINNQEMPQPKQRDFSKLRLPIITILIFTFAGLAIWASVWLITRPSDNERGLKLADDLVAALEAQNVDQVEKLVSEIGEKQSSESTNADEQRARDKAILGQIEIMSLLAQTDANRYLVELTTVDEDKTAIDAFYKIEAGEKIYVYAVRSLRLDSGWVIADTQLAAIDDEQQ